MAGSRSFSPGAAWSSGTRHSHRSRRQHLDHRRRGARCLLKLMRRPGDVLKSFERGRTGFDKAFKFPASASRPMPRFGPAARCYISEGHSSNVARVRKFNRDGNLRNRGPEGHEARRIQSPTRSWSTPKGLVYVDRENGRVQVFDPDGRLPAGLDSIGPQPERAWNQGPTGFCT